jgi:hypothetical protein
LGLPDVGGDDPRFGRSWLSGPLAAWTADGVRWSSGASRRLAREGLLKHLFRKCLADASKGALEGRQGGAPGRAGRTVEAIDEIFSDALEVKTDIGYRIRVGMRARHPWLSQGVRAKVVLS